MPDVSDSASLEERVRELERRVAIMRDVEAIRDLRRRYHERINEGRYGELVELFASDAQAHFGAFGEARGADGLRKLFSERLFSDAVTFIKQFVHNHTVELDGDLAAGFCYLEAKTVNDGESFFVAGRYDDEYVRTADGWRFSSMRLTPSFAVPVGHGWVDAWVPKPGRR